MISSALDHLDEIAASAGRRQLAVFLDYDGTLTPIVRRPVEAVLSNAMRETVRALAAKLPVAILSGRDVVEMRQRVSVAGIVYAGSHGFDIVGPRGLRKQMATEFLPVLEVAEKELGKKLAGISGALLERKRFSVAAHYRRVADESVPEVRKAVNEVALAHRELRMLPGKKVYELQPDIDWDKGKALLWLLEVMGSESREKFPIYIGDDLTDEDAFLALRQRGIGILVSEQPRPTGAHYLLKNPAEVEKFVRKLAAYVVARSGL